MEKNSTLRIQCSNCGCIQHFNNDTTFPKSVTDAHWGSFGRALYCPECTETWHTRNGNRRMATDSNTQQAAMHYTLSQRKA